MGSTPKGRLARVSKAHPPTVRTKRSMLDVPGLPEDLKRYLELRKAGDKSVGPIWWVHQYLVQGEYGVNASKPTVQAYMRERWPQLYREAMAR